MLLIPVWGGDLFRLRSAPCAPPFGAQRPNQGRMRNVSASHDGGVPMWFQVFSAGFGGEVRRDLDAEKSRRSEAQLEVVVWFFSPPNPARQMMRDGKMGQSNYRQAIPRPMDLVQTKMLSRLMSSKNWNHTVKVDPAIEVVPTLIYA